MLKRDAVPQPILAQDDMALLGGLGFLWSPRPKKSVLGLWINAVIVAPAYRGTGIASKLITQAETDAKVASQEKLFALTNIPTMNQKLEWTIVSLSEHG